MEDLEKKLEQIKEIKQFGEDLGLYFNKSFSKVDLSKSSFYLVYASYKDSIESVTTKPFEFFENNKEAEKRAKELEKAGYDVHLFYASAHAVKDCQITKSLLKETYAWKTSVILHEGFHLYLQFKKIKLPLSLEEAIASYIGYNGAIEFFKDNPNLLKKAQEQMDWWLRYAEFINRNYNLLSECYKQNGNREEIFSKAQEEAERINAPYKPNNAYFLRNIDYTKHTDLVWQILRKHSIKEYLANIDRINSILKRHI